MKNPLQTGPGGLLIYGNQCLTITVLGGVKLEGLDRMRVTLKIEVPNSPRPPVRHNLDLYNDNQLGKLVRVIAQRLEVGMSVTEATVADLIEALEQWRMDEIQKQGPEKEEAKPLTEEERAAAEQFLRDPKLMERTSQALKTSGLIGEETNAMILYVAMTSRQCDDPLSAICLARSGTGKSYLMERVALCMPEDSKMENTQFTENSFYYFRREEIRGKIFLIEDMDGAQAVMYPIRELQTKQRISKTVTVKDRSGAMRTVSLVVEGPVSVIGCSTQENIYEDNANRSLLLYLDDSKEQDARIMDYQKEARAGLIDKASEQEVRKQLQDVQRVLKPIKVVNPYAPLIALPQEVFKPRRTLGLLLGFVEAITFYHQLQREERADESSGEVYVESSPEDVQEAFALLGDTLFRKADELSGACRSFYDWLDSWTKKNTKRAKGFTGAEVRKDLRIHPRMLQRYLGELVTFGMVKITGGGKNRNGYTYTITGEHADALRERIHTSITQVIEQVKAAASERKSEEKATTRQKTTKARVSRSRSVVAQDVEEGDNSLEKEERNEKISAQ